MPMSKRAPSTSFELYGLSTEIISALKASSSSSAFVETDPFNSKVKMFNVYSESGNAFSAILMYTNIEEHVNKFFIQQLLKHKNKELYVISYHFGKIGYKGSCQVSENFTTVDDAKEEFKAIFFEKTGNQWQNKDNFKRKRTKYDLLDIDLFFNSKVFESLKKIKSKLDKRIQELFIVISGQRNLVDVVKRLLLGSVTTVVGKPTAKQMLEGFEALRAIEYLLKNNVKDQQLFEACNDYYMKVPHDFKNKVPKIIISESDIELERNKLEALSFISLSQSRLATNTLMNPLDHFYKNLGCDLHALDHETEEFKAVKSYLFAMRGPTHSIEFELKEVYKWNKQTSTYLSDGEEKLLWHGTTFSSILGIMKNGLRLPPAEASSYHTMFGKGLYFADVSSKSAQYCGYTRRNFPGILLLCKVSLGVPLTVIRSTDLSDHPSYFGSVIALGRFQPSHFTKSLLSSDALVAKGPIKTVTHEHIMLNYNEYIVYREDRVSIEYLLRIKFL